LRQPDRYLSDRARRNARILSLVFWSQEEDSGLRGVQLRNGLFALLLLTLSFQVYSQDLNDASHAAGHAAPSKLPGFHPPGDYAAVNGVKLWYESEGYGPALVLIAGGPGLSHSYFHPCFSVLATSFRIIYFDAFGTGKSDRAHDLHEYSFSRDVENLEGLRKALGLGKINVLGHSYGGMVAQAYALRWRGRAGTRGWSPTETPCRQPGRTTR
jgi:hypothetical protein